MKKILQTLIFIFFVQTSFGQFVTTWLTLKDNQEISIPINTNYTYNYNVDWGDGSISTNQIGDASHIYSVKGTYTVSITGTFPAIYINYSDARSFLKTVEQWGNNPWKSMERAFYGCTYFRVFATDSPDLSNVTDMSYMFSAINLNFDEDDNVWHIPNIENWNVSNVTNMSTLFNLVTGFNQDISSWDVSNVTNMSGMLRLLRVFNQDISGWDVSNVTDMSNMFNFTDSFNQDISGWDVSSVTNMSQMFKDTYIFNQEIGDWDVSNVTDMSYMFANTNAFNQDISDWNVSNVTDMSFMFKETKSFNQNIVGWDVSNVINMTSMFEESEVFNQDIGSWDVSKVEVMIGVFRESKSFNKDIGNWNIANVTNLNGMFYEAEAFNQNIGSWNISNVTNMNNMLNDSPITTENYDAILNGWSKQNLQPNVTLGVTNLNYCGAEIARTTLTSVPNNWIILGDSKNCNALTSIPDTNFEQYLIDENIDSDATINGQVLISDIENVTQLIIKDKNISNLTGIEGFINLVELDAANNQITTIDLSKNLLLEKLFIANNQLSTLELSKNIKLKNVDVGENSLTEIDVNLLLELESLSVYKNQLTIINLISNKELLVFIANENQLKYVDIRENINLTWLNLDDNLLEDLMLKNENNTKITIFSITGNPNLTCIEVDDASYSNLNWTNKDNTANYSIDCVPVNDDCSKSIPLTFGQLTPGDVISGTTENTNPSCAVGDVFTDVWYTFVVPSTGEFSVEGFSPIGTVKFAIYQSCASISAIACGTSISLKNLEVGTLFYLRVWLEADNSKSTTSHSNIGIFSLTVSKSSVLSDADFTKNNNELMVYPNPSSSFINIKMLDNLLLETIEIYNLIGEKVLIKSFDNLINVQLNISHLSKGVYFMKVKSNNKITSMKLIIN